MSANGFYENTASEKNKTALQSETGQAVKKALKTKIVHFTDAPEIQHFAMEKFSKYDNAYGVTWGNVVLEYLKTFYAKEEEQAEIDSFGVTYKVMKREKVTSFYDADGNTLFDVENKRLEKEYGYVIKDNEKSETKSGNSKEAEVENKQKDLLDEAKAKYESSLKACEPHEKIYFEGPIKEHMLNRFEKDNGFCRDFLQEHKTFQKCIEYMVKKARKSVPKSQNQAMVEGTVYLEWMEDYFRKDDKAEEEKKAKEAAKRKKKQAERAKKEKSVPAKAEVPKTKEEPKPKKNGKDMEGQMDMFSMMGM